MTKLNILSCLAISILLFNCSSDDSNPPETQITLDEIIAAITDNGDSKTWKIESASLTNSSVNDLDVTEAFNIKDDEFIFSADTQSISLEHRQRNDFNKEASNFETFLLDYYKSPLNYTLSASESDATQISNASNDVKFIYKNENLITGEWTFDVSTKLSFSLTVKMASDFQAPPTSLNFEEVAVIPSEYEFFESIGSADVLVSQSENSLYLMYTTDAFPNPDGVGSPRAEGVIRYDLTTNQFNNNIFHNHDFFTKRAYVSNNQLKVVGTRYFNTYNLNIDSNLESYLYNDLNPNNYTYFRYDIVINNDEIFILGGNSTIDPNSGNYFDKVLSYNEDTQTLSEVNTMPTPKSQAATEIVDGKIYIFSGTRLFGGYDTGETLSYIYDVNANTFSSFNLPETLHVSFAVAIENLIYVAGQVIEYEDDVNNSFNVLGYNAYFGAYNTEDGTFSEIQHNLDDSDELSRISGISYFNDKLYILYQNSNDPVNENYVIMSADL